MSMAAALSFSSMLSIVPFLAIVFSILKALELHNHLAPLLLSNVAAGSQEIVSSIVRYIDNTQVISLGVAGFVALFLSVMTTFSAIEESFNRICDAERGKAVHHKLRDYLLVIIAIPAAIAVVVTLVTVLQNQGAVRWLLQLSGNGTFILLHLVPFFSTWAALAFLYYFIPNVRIRTRYAVIGSLTAALALQAAQWLFISLQFGVSRHNAIYGTLALLPFFMVWIHANWLIVLAGMEVVGLLEGQ